MRHNPRIRLLMINKSASDYPWTTSTPMAGRFPRPIRRRIFRPCAWYFAREIEQREHVPVGVIDSTWGGTSAKPGRA